MSSPRPKHHRRPSYYLKYGKLYTLEIMTLMSSYQLVVKLLGTNKLVEVVQSSPMASRYYQVGCRFNASGKLVAVTEPVDILKDML